MIPIAQPATPPSACAGATPSGASTSDQNDNSHGKVRTNYIFVDFENVQDIDLDLIAGKPVKVFLVIGKRRKTLPCDLARQVHKYGRQVEWIESEGASPNALDLVLAYRLGTQANVDPRGYFHVLAKDKDYDALIQHLRANGVLASRDEDFAKIPRWSPSPGFRWRSGSNGLSSASRRTPRAGPSERNHY